MSRGLLTEVLCSSCFRPRRLLDAHMGKYDPLSAWLRRQTSDSVDLTFRDIERILGDLLPNAASGSTWWSDPDSKTTVQAKAWREAGFRAEPDVRAERIRFVRNPAK